MTKAVVTSSVQQIQERNFFRGELVERFIRFAGVNEKSAITYKIALKQLRKYFSSNAIAMPTREDLEIWRDAMIAERKSASTIQLYLTATKIFFRWLSQEGIYPNIADHLKSRVKISHDHKKDALTSKQAGKLIRGVEGDSVKSKRDRAIIGLMSSTGVRCIEVCRADVADMVEQFGKTYLLIQGKGRSSKDAKILVPSQVAELIREYLESRGKAEGEPLFVSTSNHNRGQRLTSHSISKMVKAHLREIGLDSARLTAHSLRHTAATTMIIAGVELTKVQQVLRHVNINTTMIYNNAVERMRNTAEQTAADSIFLEVIGNAKD